MNDNFGTYLKEIDVQLPQQNFRVLIYGQSDVGCHVQMGIKYLCGNEFKDNGKDLKVLIQSQ